jgi:hypothetical protein
LGKNDKIKVKTRQNVSIGPAVAHWRFMNGEEKLGRGPLIAAFELVLYKN